MELILYQDVLCSWCYLTDLRLEPLRQEFRQAVRWTVRPFPLRLQDALPTERELEDLCEEVSRARREPELAAKRLSAELWIGGDPPRSSLMALVALEAARLQGIQARTLLCRSMQRAAHEQGVNVSRTDVVFELAAKVGLSMSRFSSALRSEQTERRVLAEHRVAQSRGVRGVPTLVLGGRWMLCGLREVSEYRDHILRCLGQRGSPPAGSAEGSFTVH